MALSTTRGRRTAACFAGVLAGPPTVDFFLSRGVSSAGRVSMRESSLIDGRTRELSCGTGSRRGGECDEETGARRRARRRRAREVEPAAVVDGEGGRREGQRLGRGGPAKSSPGWARRAARGRWCSGSGACMDGLDGMGSGEQRAACESEWPAANHGWSGSQPGPAAGWRSRYIRALRRARASARCRLRPAPGGRCSRQNSSGRVLASGTGTRLTHRPRVFRHNQEMPPRQKTFLREDVFFLQYGAAITPYLREQGSAQSGRTHTRRWPRGGLLPNCTAGRDGACVRTLSLSRILSPPSWR